MKTILRFMSQQNIILDYLREHKEGLNSYIATYELKIKQAPTRVWELINKRHFQISSRQNPNGSVTWKLEAEANQPKPDVKDYIFKDGVAYRKEAPKQLEI